MVIVSVFDADTALDAMLVGGEMSMVATKVAAARMKPAVKRVAIRMACLRSEARSK